MEEFKIDVDEDVIVDVLAVNAMQIAELHAKLFGIGIRATNPVDKMLYKSLVQTFKNTINACVLTNYISPIEASRIVGGAKYKYKIDMHDWDTEQEILFAIIVKKYMNNPDIRDNLKLVAECCRKLIEMD